MSKNYQTLCDTEFPKGSNCSQSVLAYFARDPRYSYLNINPSAGAGFGGGVGNTGCICGGLAGAVMVVGYYADSLGLEPGATRALSEKMSQKLTQIFKDEYRSTCCRSIKKIHCGGASNPSHCNSIVEFMIAKTEESIAQEDAERNIRSHTSKRNVQDWINRIELVSGGAFFVISLIVALIWLLSVPLSQASQWLIFTLLLLSGGMLAGMRIWRYLRYQRK